MPYPTFSYNIADPTDAIAQLRLQIGDNDMSNTTGATAATRTVQFADEELQYFLNTAPGNDVRFAAAMALRAWARAIIVSGPNLSSQGESVDVEGQADKMNALADSLLQEIENMPAEAYAEIDWNPASMHRILANNAFRRSP